MLSWSRLFGVLVLSVTLAAGSLASAEPSDRRHQDQEPSARSLIPDSGFRSERATAFSRQVGAYIATDHLLVMPSSSASARDFDSALTRSRASIVGGIHKSGIALVHVETGSPKEILRAARQLARDPAIEIAVPDVLLEPTRVPLPMDPDPFPLQPEAWTWETKPTGGNWYLEAVRAPQAWNLIDQLSRAQQTTAAVGVIDSGFEVGHPEFADPTSPKLTLETLGGDNPNPSDAKGRQHGTGVAGIIAARWGNGVGLDGVAPALDDLGGVVGLPLGKTSSIPGAPSDAVFVGRFIDDFNRFSKKHQELSVFNASLGFGFDECRPDRTLPWLAAGISGRQRHGSELRLSKRNRFARDLANSLGRLIEEAMPDLPRKGTDAYQTDRSSDLLIAAAGNHSDLDGDTYPLDNAKCKMDLNDDGVRGGAGDNPGPIDIPAKWGTPMCNASRFHAETSILCVEATSNLPGFARANFSDGKGDISAPGEGFALLSAKPEGYTYRDRKGKRPDGHDGTSYASPLVAGIAGWTDAFNNRSEWFMRPERLYTVPMLRDDLLDGALPATQSRAPMVDFFGTLLVSAVGETLRNELVDVDDGSLFDGNARIDHDDEDNDGNKTETYPIETYATSDGVRGDGVVSMKDFRAFRDALLRTSVKDGTLAESNVALDGETWNPRNDLNLDGCVNLVGVTPSHPPPALPAPQCATSNGDEKFARFDFDGDAELSGLSLSSSFTALGDYLLLTQALTGVSSVHDCAPSSVVIGCQQAPDLLSNASYDTASTDDYINMLASADLHVDVPSDPTGQMEYLELTVGTNTLSNSFVTLMVVHIHPVGGHLIATVPVFPTHQLEIHLRGIPEPGSTVPDPFNLQIKMAAPDWGGDLDIEL